MKKSFKGMVILALVLASCKNDSEKQKETIPMDSTTVQTDHHNAKMSLDYTGTYKGFLPCADCEAIETTILLTENSYTKETIYKGKSSEVFKESGEYSWNEAGNTITLLKSEAPNQYFVGENVLFHLDADGKRIEGDLADA